MEEGGNTKRRVMSIAICLLMITSISSSITYNVGESGPSPTGAPIPDIIVEKTANVTVAKPGDLIEYTIYYNNTGPDEARTVWINDTLPEGVTFITSSAEGNRTGDYNWTFNNVPGGNIRRWDGPYLPEIRPSARTWHGMAYDSINNKVVLFGGLGNYERDETWEYDTANHLWYGPYLPTNHPTERWEHRLAYDASCNRVVLFGGISFTGKKDDTWEYDTASHTWYGPFLPTNRPSRRWGHNMVYDSANNKIVLFGGFFGMGNRADDTWEYDTATHTWNGPYLPNPRPSPRERHSMAYDSSNNRVVLFGGVVPGSQNNETWEYDSASHTWYGPYLPDPCPSQRSDQPMAFDSFNNRIVLFGGYMGNYTENNETWEYDAATHTWHGPYFPNPNPSARSRTANCMVYDSVNRRMVLFGGWDGQYDDETWEYSRSSDINYFTITVQINDDVLNGTILSNNVHLDYTDSLGNLRLDSIDTADVLVLAPENKPPVADAGPDQKIEEGEVVYFDGTGSYDPNGGTGSWIPKTNIPSPRSGGGSAVLNNELYYVGGGPGDMSPGLSNVFQKYSPATDSWYDLPNLPEQRTLIGAAAVNGKIYTFGGDGGYDTRTCNTTYMFDPATNIWTEKAPMPEAMAGYGIAVVNGRIYSIGGFSYYLDCPWCSLVLEYNTTTDTWSKKSNLPTSRKLLAATTWEGKIYAIGGVMTGMICPIEVYDPLTDTWTEKTPSPTYRAGLCAEALGGKIYVFGGTSGGDPAIDTTEVYDPESDTWTTITPMLDIRHEFGSGVIGNCIYAVGGNRGWMAGYPLNSEKYGLESELTYEWDFDASDGLWWETGATPDATGPKATHIYGDDGVYCVTLRVTDNEGLSDIDTLLITVENIAPYGTDLLWNGNFLRGTEGWNHSLHGYTTPSFISPLPPSRFSISTSNGYLETEVQDGYNQMYQDVEVNTTDLNFQARFRAVDFSRDGGLVQVKIKMFSEKPPGWSGNPPNISNLSIIQSLTVGQISWYFRPDYVYPSNNISYWELLGTGPSDWYVLDVNLHDIIVAHLPGINESKVKWLRIWIGTYGESGGFTIGNFDDFSLRKSIIVGPSSAHEGEELTFTAQATDPGSDDLFFTWNWGDGTPETVTTYYNDGVGPEPVYDPATNEGKSPWGTYPFYVTDTVIHTYGDDGVYNVTITIEDDDCGVSTYTMKVTVQNVDPTVTIESIRMEVEIGLRVAGRKYNNVSMALYEDGNSIGYVSIERLPGSPDEQIAWIPVSINFSKSYNATVTYTPEDPPNVGGNPVWIYIKSKNGSIKKIHHTFNVQQSKKRDSEHWNHVEPWEVDLNGYFIGLPFEITSHITDPGSDDHCLTYTYGSQVVNITYLNNPPNPDPYPSPEVNPVDITDTTTLIYEGPGTVTLVVKDDDNIRLGVGEGIDSFSVA